MKALVEKVSTNIDNITVGNVTEDAIKKYIATQRSMARRRINLEKNFF